MKKYLNILIGLFLFLILSCNTETKQKSEEKAYLSIKIDRNERTVLPQTFDLENDFDLSFEFSGYYTKDESVKITKTWEPTESETAYTLMTKDTEILLDTTGLWKFSLTIKKENKQLYAEEINYTIEPGENKLKFNLSYAKEGDGDLEIKLNFAKDANVKAVMAELFIFGKEEEFCEKEKLEIKTENDKSYVLYSKKNIPTDSYLVKFEFYGDEEATLFMNFYTEVVQIVANHTSSAERTVEHLNSFYEIEYKLDNTAGEEFTEGFEPETKYSPYDLPVLPKAKNVKKEGYVFAGWKNEKGEVFTKLPEGTKGNLFLTATWLEGKEIELDEAENFDYSTITEEDIIIISGEKKSGDSSLWKSLINNLNNLEIKINLNMSLVENLNTISDNFFKGFDNLKRITIPDSVKEIGNYVFRDCTSLTDVELGNGVETIGSHLFVDCSSLEEITIPDNIKEIGEGVFQDCTSLTNVKLGNGLESIADHAFRSCSSLEKITIPNNVKQIGRFSFSNCTKLTDVELGNGVESIADYAFEYCSSLEEITIPDNVKTIEDYVFSECISLTNVKLGNGVEIIGKKAFEKCSSLEEITIPDNIKEIGESVFQDCTSLTNVKIGNGVESIADYAFRSCSSLEEITIPNNVKQIGRFSFSDCTKLTDVELGNGVESIANYAFGYCSSLEEITIPDNVKEMGESVFKDCTKLTNVSLGKGIEIIGESCFNYCSSLKEIKIPDNVKEIGRFSFRYCTNLTDVELGKGIETIADYAFGNCSSLENITFNDTSNWYRSTDNIYPYESGIPIDVSDPEKNAELLSTDYNYVEFYLYKK